MIDRGGVLAVYALFSDAERVIVTVYFLNQGRGNRRFANLEEFGALRDKFLERFTACANDARGR